MERAPLHQLTVVVLTVAIALTAYAAEAPPSEVAFKQASAAGKHLFVFFFDEDNETTRTARTATEKVLARMSDVALQIVIQKDAPEETGFVTKYGVDTAPMPLVLVLAPNGAVTLGCFGQDITEDRLRSGIASPAQQQCLKALEDKKVVVLCAIGKDVAEDAPALKGIRDFKADPKNAAVEVVRLDPTDDAEAGFAKQLNIDPKAETTTLVLAPPRALLKRFDGEVTKEGLAAALKAPAPG